MAHMDTQLHSLDDIVSRIRAQNDIHHTAHTASLDALSSTVQTSYSSIGDHLSASFERVQSLEADMATQTTALRETLPELAEEATVRAPLHELRHMIQGQKLTEYNPTGETPQRVAYKVPTDLPRTEAHESLLSRLRDRPASSDASRSPLKGQVFMDVTNSANNTTTSSEDFFSLSLNKPVFSRSITAPGMGAPSLRELDVNVISQESQTVPLASLSDTLVPAPAQKKQIRGDGDNCKLPMKKMARKTVAGAGFGASHGPSDRENLTITNFSSSVGPGTRRLRSHGSQ